MPTELPSWLQEAFRIVGGQAWPEGDEDGLNRIADAWKKMASDIEVLEDAVRASAADVSRDMRGDFANAYRNYAEGKGAESLTELKKNAQERSDQARNTAADIQAAKVAIIVQLGFVAAAIATAFIPIVGGAISTGIVATVRLAISQIIKNVLLNITKNVVTNVVIGEAIAMATEVGTQGIQKATGQRTEWNDDRIKGAAISGAFGGVGGGLATSAAEGVGRAIARGALGQAAKKGLETAAGQAAGAVANAGLQGAAGYAGEKAAGAVQGHDETNSYSFTSAMAGGFGRLGGGKSTSHAPDPAASAAAVDKAAGDTSVGTPKTESLGPVTTAAGNGVQTESAGSTDKSGVGSGSSETNAGEGLPAYAKQDPTLPGYSETGGESGAANNAGAASAATLAAGHAATTSQQSSASGTTGQHSATSSGDSAAAKQEQGTTTGQQQRPTTSSGMATDKSPSVSTVSDGTSQANSTGAGTQAGNLQTTSTGQDHQTASENAQTHQEQATTQHQEVGKQEVAQHQGTGQQQEVAAHQGAGQSQGGGQQEVAPSLQEAGQVGEQQEAAPHQGAGQDQGAGQHQQVATHPETGQHQEASAENQAESQHQVGSEHQDGSPQHQTTNPVEQHSGAAEHDTSHTTEQAVESHATHGESDTSQHGTPVHSTETTVENRETAASPHTVETTAKQASHTGTSTSSAVTTHADFPAATASSPHATHTSVSTGESTQNLGTTASAVQHEPVGPNPDPTPKRETNEAPQEHSTEHASTTQQETPPGMLPPLAQPTAHHSSAEQSTGQPAGQRGPVPSATPTPVVRQRPVTASVDVPKTSSQGSLHIPATESRPTTSSAPGQKTAAATSAGAGDGRPPQLKGKEPMRSARASTDEFVGGKSEQAAKGTRSTSDAVVGQAKQEAFRLAREMNLHYGGDDAKLRAEHRENLDELAARYEQGGELAARDFVRELRGPEDDPNPLYQDWATKPRGFGGSSDRLNSLLMDDMDVLLDEAGPSGSRDTTMAEADASNVDHAGQSGWLDSFLMDDMDELLAPDQGAASSLVDSGVPPVTDSSNPHSGHATASSALPPPGPARFRLRLPPKGTPERAAVLAGVRADRENGKTTEDLAKEHGVNQTSIGSWLKEAGYKGSVLPPKGTPERAAVLAGVRADRENGKTTEDLAK
ncbi:hypothetical protein AB0H34_45930, partial [Saccharopolyspora shandongensis]|uniref:WXG100-like domain-containing protein n=1 Tax=Saccharopolyspora shandongensis TaxID=418495 RepID=UPI0033E4F07E